MTGARALLFAVVLGVASAAVAQPSGNTLLTRDAGIRGMFDGRYDVAVSALGPLAEGPNQSDPVAEFFMGFLYYSGLGVKSDRPHACRLFTDAASPDSPFERTAAILAHVLQAQVLPSSCEGMLSVKRPRFGDPSFTISAHTSPPELADAVIAITHADYQSAVDILQPMTETSFAVDPDAGFFMAVLYNEGRGVPQDPLRACAHFSQTGYATMRPGFAAGGPFGGTAELLFATIVSNNPELTAECNDLSVVGFNTRFRPETFQLGPGHWVDWDWRGATVWYQGTSKRFPNLVRPMGGGVYLPLKHTELDAGPTRSDRRDFIEVAIWQPVIPNSRWRLEWQLFEVVRGDLLPVAGADVAIADQASAPATSDSDLEEMVRLEVNGDGDAAWTLVGRNALQTHVLPTETDRAADLVARARTRAHDEAFAQAMKMAGSSLKDSDREPSFNYVNTTNDACGTVAVVSWNADHTEALLVQTLEAKPPTGTFDLQRSPGLIRVEAHVFNQFVGRLNGFCTDVRDPGVPGQVERVWRAISGIAKVEVAPPSSRHRQEREATVTISDAVFLGPNGETVRFSRPVVITAYVGALLIGG